MTVNCPSCKEKSFLYFQTKDVNRQLSREKFSYYRCPSCELIFLFPVPANLSEFYPADYYAIPSSLEQLAWGDYLEGYKIEIIQSLVPRGRLLEIGPAVGGFAYLAKRAGFEVEAIEMDARCCQFLTDVVGIRAVQSSDIEAALRAAEPYNVIALWHVIEHLPNPWETIKAAAERLLPDGILAIAAPNPAAFQFKVLGRYWTHVDAPRHVLLIPMQLLVQRAEALGLKAVLITTTDRGTLGWNVFGWQHSLSNFFTGEKAKSAMRKVGSATTRLLRPIEQNGFRGSTYTVVFQKK